MSHKYVVSYKFNCTDGRYVSHKAIVEVKDTSLTPEEIADKTVKTIMESGYFYFRSEKTNATIGININNVDCVEVRVMEVEEEI